MPPDINVEGKLCTDIDRAPVCTHRRTGRGDLRWVLKNRKFEKGYVDEA
jgi:hypothetical protein